MNGFYINLDKDVKKREAMETTLTKLNLPIKRFPAVYGKEVDKNSIKDTFTNDYLKFCNDGIIGCALSHISIWQKIITENLDNVIILEDDVIFTNDAASQLQQLYLSFPKDYDIVYIGCSGVCGTKCKGIFGTQICEKYNDLLNKPIWSTDGHGYILSQKGARKILANILPLDMVFDGKIGYLITNKIINGYSLNKPIAYQTKESSATVDSRKKILGKLFPIINQPIFRIPLSYPMDFYFDIYSLIVIVLSILIAYKYKDYSDIYFILLLFFNWIDVIFGYTSLSDRKKNYQSAIDTFVPIIIYFIITKTLCTKDCAKECKLISKRK